METIDDFFYPNNPQELSPWLDVQRGKITVTEDELNLKKMFKDKFGIDSECQFGNGLTYRVWAGNKGRRDDIEIVNFTAIGIRDTMKREISRLEVHPSWAGPQQLRCEKVVNGDETHYAITEEKLVTDFIEDWTKNVIVARATYNGQKIDRVQWRIYAPHEGEIIVKGDCRAEEPPRSSVSYNSAFSPNPVTVSQTTAIYTAKKKEIRGRKTYITACNAKGTTITIHSGGKSVDFTFPSTVADDRDVVSYFCNAVRNHVNHFRSKNPKALI